jgi:3-oxoacyl-[acyl-carrier protein] reductase
MIELAGQTALITGGSRGIGRAAALLLARAGADVALTYHTREDDAQSTAQEIRSLGRRVHLSGGDLGNPETSQRLAAALRCTRRPRLRIS